MPSEALLGERRAHDLVLAVRREQRAEEGHQRDQQGDHQPGHRRSAVCRVSLVPHAAAEALRACAGVTAHDEIAVLARGVSRIESRSAIRFTPT